MLVFMTLAYGVVIAVALRSSPGAPRSQDAAAAQASLEKLDSYKVREIRRMRAGSY